jgi:hypothetical protein
MAGNREANEFTLQAHAGSDAARMCEMVVVGVVAQALVVFADPLRVRLRAT